MTRIGFGARMWLGAVAAAAAAAGAAFGQTGSAGQAPKAKLSLFSSVEAVVPGKPFDVGIQFKLERGWHTYWQNSGESGKPPTVSWMLPDGFEVGELRFPAPDTHVSPGPITTYILEHDPVLLSRITPVATLVDKSVRLAAKVNYLVCEKSCLIESADLKLDLAVSQGGEPKPANEALFATARAAIPKDKHDLVAVSARTDPAAPAKGQPFDLILDVTIKDGHRVPSNRPGSDKAKPFEVFPGRVDGVWKSPVYPPGTDRDDPKLGKVNEYAGKVAIRTPGQVDSEAPAGPYAISGVAKFQTCDDKGSCTEVQALAFSVPPAPAEKGGAGATGPAPAATPPVSTQPTRGSSVSGSGFFARLGLPGLLLACFLYGLFINVTPCVLPLLSIKVLGFVQQAHDSRSRTFALGLSFGAGVILFFVLLGLLASSGKNVLQYPVAVIALGSLVTALALSMLGVYTLQVPTAAVNLEQRISREGMLSSFGKGALAPVLGFACTGPLLAGAFGWATQQPPRVAILAFVVAGLGMASPYVLLGANPKWLSFLPKPGQWMITFERIMGFLLLGMVVLLLHPLSAQIGPDGLEWTLVFLVVVAMACWLLGKIDYSMDDATRWRYRGSAAALIVVGAALVYGWVFPIGEAQARVASAAIRGRVEPDDWSQGIPWQRWSPEAVEAAVRSGRTVFVDFTAAYCTQCKVNKAIAINTQEVRDKMKSLGVVAFQGDFTSGDPVISQELGRFGRGGVPMNLIYPAARPDDPILLDTALFKHDLLARLDEAGPSRMAAAAMSGS